MSLIVDRRGSIFILTLNRPNALNAIDADLLKKLNKAMHDFKDDDDLRVAIITGNGKRAFSTGADIGMIANDIEGFSASGNKFPLDILNEQGVYKPLIAAVNGAALGGGLELALACDLRIAAERAFFGFPETSLGLIPGWGGTQRLPRLIPQCKAAELLFTGRPINAQEAWRIGLVNKVVPPDKLMDETLQTAEEILRQAPLAIRAAKQAMSEGAELTLKKGLQLEQALFRELIGTRDFSEGLSARQENRRPKFEGR
jgi:enoyl-CoA hydratase/carnithine racemase